MSTIAYRVTREGELWAISRNGAPGMGYATQEAAFEVAVGANEAASVEALADRLIPPDPETPGGKEAGCAVYLDRQLARPHGSRRGLYVNPPFLKGTSTQGPQGADGTGRAISEGACRPRRLYPGA